MAIIRESEAFRVAMTEYERLYNLYLRKSNEDLLKIINSQNEYTNTAVQVASDILNSIRGVEDKQLLEQNSHTVEPRISGNFFKRKAVKLFNMFTAPKVNNPAPLDPVDISVSVQYNNFVSPNVTVQTKDSTEIYDSKTEYVRISTSGDENVCAMCAQFEGKFFPAKDAPKLPLCPSCTCTYEYYYSKEDLPSNVAISNKDDFVLPAECTPMFYAKQQKAYEGNDTEKCIRLCESQMKKLHEFMEPYISAGFPAPSELACRDLLPDLYMQLGQWKKAKNTIKKCISANAYYPRDGSDELASLESYQKVATETLSYISQNPGCLQRNLYKTMGYEGDEKEHLKYFLHSSIQIEKVEHSNTYQLFCRTDNRVDKVQE